MYTNSVHAQSNDLVYAKTFVTNLSNNALKIVKDEKTRLEKFKSLVHENFAITSIAKFALGQSKNKISDETQRKEFQDCFVHMLVRTYSDQFEEFKNASISITSAKPKGSTVYVYSKVKTPSERDIEIVWIVKNKKIQDIKVDGISMRQVQKEYISGRISELGWNKFIANFSSEYKNLSAEKHHAS